MGPRGVFRHDVCGRVQRIVHGIATMRATRAPPRFKPRRADTPSVGPVGCQEVAKSGARVGTPTVERVPRKRQYSHLVRESSPTLCWCADGIWRHHRGACKRKVCKMLQNGHSQNMFARIPMEWMWAVGLQFGRIVWTQASILVFLSLLEIPLRGTGFFGVARGHSRGGHFHCYRRAGIAQSGPHPGGGILVSKMSQYE